MASLSSAGAYLLDNGVEMLLFVGKAARPELVRALFGVDTLEGTDTSQVRSRAARACVCVGGAVGGPL